MSKNTKTVKIIAFLFLLVLALAWLFPLIWGVFTSFKSETEIKTCLLYTSSSKSIYKSLSGLSA